MSDPVVRQIKKTKTYQLVASELVHDIVVNDLQAGDDVPTERELSERYGVGRSSVREGLRLLEAHGVILPGARNGSYKAGARNAVLVSGLEMLVLLGQASLEDIHQLRQTVEIEAVRLAARNREAADIERIRVALCAMIEARGNQSSGLEADLNFHVAVARASKNGALVASVVGVRAALREHIEERQFDLDEAIAQHQFIVEAIVAKDEKAAVKAMEDHMHWIEDT